MSFECRAQNAFGVREMAQHSDMGGYNTYHDNSRGQRDRPVHLYRPEPSFDRPLMVGDDRGEKNDDGILGRVDGGRSEVTPLEDFYRKRSGDDKLNQFGYDLFYQFDKNHKNDIDDNYVAMPFGVVQDNYVVQVGDEIAVIFSGEKDGKSTYKVGTDGRVFIDGFSFLSVAGKTISALNDEVRLIAGNLNYRGGVHVTVEGMRQIGVLIAGHVEKPGRHNLNVFHSVIDALQMAGGVRKTGSLRQIKLIRKGQTETIDLYGFLNQGILSKKMQLSDGDRIIVPPIGQTIAVVGDVKQAGIFELGATIPQTVQKIAPFDALQMAGGVLGAGDNQITLKDAQSKIITLNNLGHKVVGDGSIITVTRANDIAGNAVTLAGYSRKNGVYGLSSVSTLQKLLKGRNVFGDDVYPLMGVVSRVNRKSLTRRLMGFSPQLISLGEDDRQLEAGDIVYLFSYDDIAMIKQEQDHKNVSAKGDVKPVFPKRVRDFVLDNSVTIQGAIRDAGQWPVGSIGNLQTLISVAGGITSKADIQNIEIVSKDDDGLHDRKKVNARQKSMKSIILYPGDQVRMNKRFEKAVAHSVQITGEVKNPGTYDLMRGDTLLSLINRAGGLTEQAYPPAAVFSRQAERKREEQKFRAAAQELERTVSVSLNAEDKGGALTPEQISMARGLANDLRSVKALGRVTVEADPAILSSRPELDMLLEKGDRLHIPKRHLTVRVTGEVMNGASLLFEDQKDPEDYIREAGGLTYYADQARIFVLYPDGASAPLRGSSWKNTKQAIVIPGSTIIVPRDPKPFDFVDSFKDITQILTNMAITTVFIDDVVSD